MGHRRYIGKKIFHALLTIFFVLTFNFFLFRVMPGDPISLLARSERLTPQDIAEQKRLYGLDAPLPEQYLIYLRQTLTGHLGVSLRTGESVSATIWDRLPPTVLLVGLGTLLAAGFGVLIGIRGAWHRGSAFDNSTLLGSLVLYSVPEGWLGMLLLILFAGTLGWFPAGGYSSGTTTGFARVIDIANHLVLPLLTLTLGYIGEYVIIMRSSLLEVMNEDFLLTARAKGVPERLVRRDHAVRNAFLPTFSLLCLSFGFILGGAIVIETVFSWPGLGELTYDAINQLDYPVLQGVFLVSSIAVILANLAADLTYGYLDPRIREA
ncbi:MAG TPA: ABC transporter permease [Actinomycetota bacterium]|nr:ABC transporter permease [Actinomycetota bacterium]